ncbi:unnamed protein product [Paramecium primaurelia]|uniref:Uncharacterized protein n=1 Tax=Paramecium primaurelia TaxID=5886 RepID=A0A8S1L4X5_PARPR|nr:unnamed protein product [Paramecium primaurelia]CAD8059800.1 unnamed protein product [Paramecium primaurelia]
MNSKNSLIKNYSQIPTFIKTLNNFKTVRIRSLKNLSIQPVAKKSLFTNFSKPNTKFNSPIKNKENLMAKQNDLIINGIDSDSLHFSYSPSSCKKIQYQKQVFNRKLKQTSKLDQKTKQLCNIYLERPKSKMNNLFQNQVNQPIIRIR